MQPTEITYPQPPEAKRRYMPNREAVGLAALAGFILGFGFSTATTDPPEPVPVIVDIGEPATLLRPPDTRVPDNTLAEPAKQASEGFSIHKGEAS